MPPGAVGAVFVLDLDLPFRNGERMKMIGGAAAGLTWLLDSADGDACVVIPLDLLGRRVRGGVPVDSVAAV